MKRAICIGCGCDEEHACTILGAGIHQYTCWWARFEAATRVGVCSACWDLVKVWDASKVRKPILPLIAERFYRQAMFLYDDQASALAWINSPQPLLAGRSPRELILAGELERVQVVLDQVRSGAYV